MNTRDLQQLNPNFVPCKKPAKRSVYSIIYYSVGIFLSLLFVLPLFYMLAASTKSVDSIAHSAGTPMMFIPDFTNMAHFFDNYAVVFGDYGLWKYALNSLLYAVIIIIFNVLVNGLAGYALAKFHFPGKKFFNFIILFLIIVPVETSIIPLYAICQNMLHLTKNAPIAAILFPGIISIFNIFLFKQFFMSIPKEYEEAMHVDGASRVRIFFDLILPMSKPIVATVVVFTFIGVWSDYIWPTMVLPEPKGSSEWPLYPIQAAVFSIQNMGNGLEAGQMMAVLFVTTLPIFIIYAIAQKYIVKGFGTAGLKM